jgi:hypothetical protein
MDKDSINELAKNPRFIAGIYNYCDRWCERCIFTSRCMNYALSEEEFGDPESRDINNMAFWNKLGEILSTTLEMVKEKAQKMGIDIDAIDFDEAAEENERINETAKEQPYSLTAMEYIRMVDDWFKSNKENLETKADELESLAQARIPGTSPYKEAVDINDCFEVISWYKHQIYVKLCRAAGGTIRSESESVENFQEDADGSAKVAIIGIERSITAWSALLQYLPEQEHSIFRLLIILNRILSMVEAAFPNARAFVRPGFDTTD